MTAVLRALMAVTAAVLLVHGVAPGPEAPGSPVSRSEPFTLAAQAPPQTAPVPSPASVPEDTDHDGCPKPWEQPGAAGWHKSPPPPSRNGGPPPQRARAVAETASLAGTSGAGAFALRRARPTGPRLPVFRC
ncbi:hypothetical protein Skr01_64270 [Sphaerisporangium krabiense]|uniref:Secreted protein n=1 Tax=Sphaerisporangium krabiense TaxID=763782 RepID=A0A7W9DRD4_9ACTN|nr:hypothetical protein [Sphaerisporangium krabiense]MBB5628343.1 hypothetical protein [Sphaerisporangium krabiense]GII66342.1 hypothetical protein Skr01_64270 [Sphaerisporangium krabiense]